MWLTYHNNDINAATYDQPHRVPRSYPDSSEFNQALRKAGSLDGWPKIFNAWMGRKLGQPQAGGTTTLGMF